MSRDDYPSDDEPSSVLPGVNAWFRYLKAALLRIEERQIAMTKTLDDILADQEATLTKIANLTTVENGVAALVTAQKQTLTDLRQQIAAANTSNDPKIQQIADNMDKINAAIDVQATTDAVVTGAAT